MYDEYFDVWPKVVPVDKQTEITIKASFKHVSRKLTDSMVVRYVSDNSNRVDGSCIANADFDEIPFERDGDTLRLTTFFAGECAHTLQLVSKDENNQANVIANFYIYSLEADLFALRPFKGDFHLHSFCSDGRESPAYVAGASRRIGLDFMALTDHHSYDPSLEAIAAMNELQTDLKCYPGEEVHCPDNPVHIVNFGGSFSVNELYKKNEAKYRAEVAKYEADISADLLPELRFQIASSEWAFDKIREAKGLAIYSHPYWRPNERFYVNSKVNDALLEAQRFDALEVIGGFYKYQMEANALSVARYQEERSKGKKIPIVGVSDSHGCDRDLFGWYYTITLANSADFTDVANAIMSLNSVAVEAVPGEFPRLVGSFRQVQYCYFLMREFFPIHDKLCRHEGDLILASLAGDDSAKAKLADLKGQVPSLLNKYWA